MGARSRNSLIVVPAVTVVAVSIMLSIRHHCLCLKGTCS